jgi:hypothetical protein
MKPIGKLLEDGISEDLLIFLQNDYEATLLVCEKSESRYMRSKHNRDMARYSLILAGNIIGKNEKEREAQLALETTTFESDLLDCKEALYRDQALLDIARTRRQLVDRILKQREVPHE